MNRLIVLGAAAFAGGVAFLGIQFGWPFLIGFAVGAFCGYWNHDLIKEDRANQQREGQH